MPTIKLREGDTFESAMRKFKRMVDKTRILQELRLREFHLNNSVIKQRKKAAAKKRLAKKLSRERAIFRDVVRASTHHYHYPDKGSKSKEVNTSNN